MIRPMIAGSTVMRVGPVRAGLSPTGRRAGDSFRSIVPPVVYEFTAAWERGESPVAEDYLRRLDPDDVQGAVDLIYREYCLAESDGRSPDSDAYIARFPRYAEPLRDLLRVHGACSPSLLARLMGPPPASGDDGSGLPEVGDSIGPYRLRRELGRGSFARVFLAEQTDLSDRLVVVKIARRYSREPWLLARARHAHIVEIVSHAMVDDGAFQLICMPFWGGATLADVLAAPGSGSSTGSGRPGSSFSGEPPRRVGRLRRWGKDRGPRTGADLLAALDAVGAPEYPTVHPARPAREILAPLSYDRAIAWVVARLAEGLDHAADRDVAHGDVKPSNILLAADGSPMLLDFNLAREGPPSFDPNGRSIDPGGTLAYMAPERLRDLSDADPDRAIAMDSDSAVGWSSEVGAPAPRVDDRSAHVSDIYSLGMVLLEALSGRPPSEAAIPGDVGADPASRTPRLISTARAYATARERPASAMVRDFEAASGRPIAPAIRAILGRCLDPDPDRRYRRALELAEDLDRWRSDRPLAYADEPFWGQALPRWWRARRRKILIAAISIAAMAMAATATMQVASNRLLRRESRAMALAKVSRWDDPQSGAFLRSQRRASPRFWAADDPEVLALARRALVDYGVIGPGGAPVEEDWRLRDDVRLLPVAERADLEVWLVERGYRYAAAMADRPGAPEDWRQASAILDRLDAGRSLRAFATLRDRLAARPGGPAAPASASAIATISPAPAWLDEHLLGFAAEGEDEAGEPEDDGLHRAAIERALEHYEHALAIRPGSFWGHYRAATAEFALGRASEAAHHLSQCLARRPDNVEVRLELAGRLYELGRYGEALEHCDLAMERAPRHAELYRTRILARASSRQTGGIGDDVRHFEMFSRILPPSFWGGTGPGLAAIEAEPLASPLASPPASWAALAPAPGPSAAIGAGPEEIDIRTHVAEALRGAGLSPMARAELDKILLIRPDHIHSRITRAQLAIDEGRFLDARADLRVALDHPRLEDYVRDYPGALDSLFVLTRQYLKAGRTDDARRVAQRGRELAIGVNREVGKAHYHLALAYAVLGATDPDYIEPAAKHLFRAFVANPEFQGWYRNPNPWLDPVRHRLDMELGRMEDPSTVRRRFRARSSGVAKVAER